MKYIRTEDGHLLEVIRESESKKSYITKPNGWVIHKYRVIKQAENIEELCDEFVIEKKEPFIGKLEDLPRLKELVKGAEKIDIHWNLFGAIWTYKGLIYVAQLTEKGWELL